MLQATGRQTNDLEALEQLTNAAQAIRQEIGKVIVGQEQVIEELLIGLFASGHCLIIGVPGLAKTLLINTLARVLSLSFNRVQFTPDLMPSDITGTEIIEEDPTTGHRKFKFIPGPIFANVVLADEINRTPPKTQAALLQAMQEKKVTSGGTTYELDPPFFVLATQNPIEQEGTYPLPEAQLDRFMFSVNIDYPSSDEEMEIVRTTTSAYEADLQQVLKGAEIVQLQKLVRRVPVADPVVEYAVQLVRLSRPHNGDSPQFVKDWVSWGAGPRASQYLILGAKTRAALEGRTTPSREDIRAVARAVLRHRLVTNFNAEADGIGSIQVVERLLEQMKG